MLPQSIQVGVYTAVVTFLLAAIPAQLDDDMPGMDVMRAHAAHPVEAALGTGVLAAVGFELARGMGS